LGFSKLTDEEYFIFSDILNPEIKKREDYYLPYKLFREKNIK
jgi:hypothetical protein